MNFKLTADQQMLVETVQRMVQDSGRTAAARSAVDRHDDSQQIWKQLIDLGIGGCMVPEEYGGSDLSLTDLALVAEVLGAFVVPGPFLGHALATISILLGGDEAQKRKWLPALAAGEALGTVALRSPDTGCWECEFKEGAVTGSVRDVPSGDIADLVIVGVEGGRLAVVERNDHVASVSVEGVDRTRSLVDLRFDRAPAVLLENSADAAHRLIDALCVLVAADAFGGARACLDMACAYACEREQFGRLIGSFQGLKFQLADLAVDVEPCRGLYWYAAYSWDKRLDDSRIAAAAAKAHCSEIYVKAARTNVETHGGIGYTWEHDAHLYLKRAIFNHSWIGSPGEHRERQAVLNGWHAAAPQDIAGSAAA